MKKFAFALAALMVVSTASYAQNFGWGVKAGLNVSNISDTDLNAKTGLTAGVFADYRFSNDWFGLSADLLFSRQGGRDNHNGSKFILKSNYLNLPIMAKFYVIDNLAVNIGIQPGVLLSAKAKVKEGSDDYSRSVTDQYKNFDFAFPMGVSYDINEKFIIDARYNLGVTKVADDNDKSDAKNNVFAFTVGYRF